MRPIGASKTVTQGGVKMYDWVLSAGRNEEINDTVFLFLVFIILKTR